MGGKEGNSAQKTSSGNVYMPLDTAHSSELGRWQNEVSRIKIMSQITDIQDRNKPIAPIVHIRTH